MLSISETDIAVIKEIAPNGDTKEINKIAANIESALASELNIKTVIGVATRWQSTCASWQTDIKRHRWHRRGKGV